MTKIKEIENAVESLPDNDYRNFRKWFYHRDWEKWDHQIIMDSKNGKLDFMKKEAADAIEHSDTIDI
ncbi:MAG: hypothetical protein JXB24_14560 [Bacteroidales bacterium]|nr:hypothetical protein [Bacteroidales bacterium]